MIYSLSVGKMNPHIRLNKDSAFFQSEILYQNFAISLMDFYGMTLSVSLIMFPPYTITKVILISHWVLVGHVLFCQLIIFWNHLIHFAHKSFVLAVLPDGS